MIITKVVEIILTNRNITRYKELILDIEIGINNIPVEYLSKNSLIKVDVICDICNNTKIINYKNYIKNISSGGFYACSNKCAVIKGENTCIKKYGTKYALQNEDIKQKTKDYFTEKFGVDNPSKCKEVCDKREETMMKRFGVKTNIILPDTHKKAIEVSCTDESKLKREETMIERYGVRNCMMNTDVYNRFKETNIVKYGCEYPAQNVDIFDKTQKAQFKMKYFNDIRYQGTYELDFLTHCNDNGYLDKISKVKSIKYTFENNNKVYHPDFYIEELNLIIEIKSDYYYNLYLDKNIEKRKSCIEKGYNFLFIINKDYTILNEKIKAII